MKPYNYSIIIPHYNIPDLLERLLSSIPKRDDLQIIVVDDCSNSEMQQYINKIKERNPSVEFYSTNIRGGGGKARNVGLQHAKGKFLIFADSDDYFNLCFNKALDDYKDSDADIIYFSANSVDTDTYENAERAEYFHRIIHSYLESGDDNNLRFAFVVPWGRFIRRDIIEKNNVNFDEVPVSNDIWFSTVSDYYAKKLTADKRAIYCVTDRIDSTSKQQKPEEMLSRLKTSMKRHNFMRLHNVSRHLGTEYLMMPLKEVYETKNRELIDEVEKLLQENKISVTYIRKLIRNWDRRQFAHNFLKKLHLQRIH